MGDEGGGARIVDDDEVQEKGTSGNNPEVNGQARTGKLLSSTVHFVTLSG